MDQALKILSVNVGQPTPLDLGRKVTTTGIDKRAVAGRVSVTARGLEGDHILSKRHHGGPDQAAYLYTAPDYDFWTEALGEAPAHGQFGENLVLSGLESAGLRVGDRLEVGEAGGLLLEVTAPRIPCATFAAHMGDPAFVKKFAAARRPGAYLRVLNPGTVAAGDPVRFVPVAPGVVAEDGGAPTLGELFALWYEAHPSPGRLRALLAYPLARRLRKNVEEWLADSAPTPGT